MFQTNDLSFCRKTRFSRSLRAGRRSAASRFTFLDEKALSAIQCRTASYEAIKNQAIYSPNMQSQLERDGLPVFLVTARRKISQLFRQTAKIL